MTMNIEIKSINDAKDFVNITTKYPFEILISSGCYRVDGKSIMGIFSLDLSKPITVEVNEPDCEKFFEEIKVFKSK